jgi:aspartate/methionine/tyrosine aminotransferase
VRLAHRIGPLEPFLAMEVMERAFEMEREGTRVIHLEIGEPDFPPPPEVVEACQRALARGETHYSSSLGLPELREAIAEDHERRHGTRIDPECVLVTNGTSPAMLLVFALLVEEGDEVILGAPHYPCYPNFIRVFGGAPVFVPTDPAAGYRLDPDAVRRSLTPRTRAIVVGSPANPTGAVQDERLGYVIAPRNAIRPLQILQQNLFISANRFVQHAGIAALRHGGTTLEAMRSAYARRRGLLVEGLRGLGFGVPALPPGAFYVFADARPFDSDSKRLAFSLLESARVATTPGIDFGAEGEGWLRFCYAASEAEIEEAIVLLGAALARLDAAGEPER